MCVFDFLRVLYIHSTWIGGSASFIISTKRYFSRFLLTVWMNAFYSVFLWNEVDIFNRITDSLLKKCFRLLGVCFYNTRQVFKHFSVGCHFLSIILCSRSAPLFPYCRASCILYQCIIVWTEITIYIKHEYIFLNIKTNTVFLFFPDITRPWLRWIALANLGKVR